MGSYKSKLSIALIIIAGLVLGATGIANASNNAKPKPYSPEDVEACEETSVKLCEEIAIPEPLVSSSEDGYTTTQVVKLCISNIENVNENNTSGKFLDVYDLSDTYSSEEELTSKLDDEAAINTEACLICGEYSISTTDYPSCDDLDDDFLNLFGSANTYTKNISGITDEDVSFYDYTTYKLSWPNLKTAANNAGNDTTQNGFVIENYNNKPYLTWYFGGENLTHHYSRISDDEVFPEQFSIEVPSEIDDEEKQYDVNLYCWDNPYYNSEKYDNTKNYEDIKIASIVRNSVGEYFNGADGWNSFASEMLNNVSRHESDNGKAIYDEEKTSNSCYICGFFRGEWTGKGCFPPGEKVMLENGLYKNVEEVSVGDKLYNPILRKGVSVKNLVEGPEEISLMEIGDQQGTVKLTQDHPVLTDKGVKQAVDLKIGDIIFDKDNNKRQLTIVKMLPIAEGQYVINFNLDIESDSPEQHLIVSENIVTGDWALQNSIIEKNQQN